MQWHARVREPCGSGVSEIVSSQTWVAESLHQVRPVGRSRERPGGEDSASGALRERLIMFAVLGYPSEHRLQRIEDRLISPPD
ncbi:hypothetical protein GCM10027416_19610 [Okibacterium endophyticum]